MTYSMKQVRYSGVKDGNTSHNQGYTLTQADSHDETQDIPVYLGPFLSTVLRICVWTNPRSGTDYLIICLSFIVVFHFST